MREKIPIFKDDYKVSEKVSLREGYIAQTREYELITPLFGGGVEPGNADPVTTIRATEIRGHLRFWWRATRCGQFDEKLENMKEAENKLWGAASKPGYARPSEVRVATRVISEGNAVTPYEKYRKGRSRAQANIAPPYAAFPLQPTQDEMTIGLKSKTLRSNVRFLLTLEYPQGKAEEVEAAIWAWELFGGIGARTRRGFGAICLTNGDDLVKIPEQLNSVDDVSEWLAGELENTPYVKDERPPDKISHLRFDPLFELTGIERNAHNAWSNLIELYRKFRQQRPDGNPTPGRSKWPEPEFIRDLTRQRHDRHQPIPYLRNIRRFPRAAFGLPIIFQFKDHDKKNPLGQRSDPRPTSLRLFDSERLASPLILRPLKLARDKFVGVALALEGVLMPNKMKLILEDSGLTERFRRNSNLPTKDFLLANLDITQAHSLKMKDNKTPLMFGKDDVVMAFLEYLKSERGKKR
ncbi:MAG: type III-B CRISPR module RAMP protein Cmr1 [Blastocatellia bacterium]|nr:type III-B CRISPR module RAMP protein Cmr1 [Blastocatellia bacterium]